MHPSSHASSPGRNTMPCAAHHTDRRSRASTSAPTHTPCRRPANARASQQNPQTKHPHTQRPVPLPPQHLAIITTTTHPVAIRRNHVVPPCAPTTTLHQPTPTLPPPQAHHPLQSAPAIRLGHTAAPCARTHACHQARTNCAPIRAVRQASQSVSQPAGPQVS